MSWICPSCAEENEDISKFCIFCSTKKPGEEKESIGKTINEEIVNTLEKSLNYSLDSENKEQNTKAIQKKNKFKDSESYVQKETKKVKETITEKEQKEIFKSTPEDILNFEKSKIESTKKEQKEELVKEIVVTPPKKNNIKETPEKENNDSENTVKNEFIEYKQEIIDNKEKKKKNSKSRRGNIDNLEEQKEGLSEDILDEVKQASEDAIKNSKISAKTERKRNKKKTSKFFSKPIIPVFGKKKKETIEEAKKETEIQNGEIEEIISIDSESGLKTTRELHRTLGTISTENLCVVALGINGFEKNYSINLELTHDVVNTMGGCVKKTFGEENCYRALKDEFVVLLENTSILEADKKMLLLKKNMQEAMDLTGGEIYITFAVGIVQGSAKSSPKLLLKEAERILEEDKIKKEMISPNERKEKGDLYIPNHDGYYNDIEPIPEDYQKEFAAETIKKAIILVIGTVIGILIFEMMMML